MESKTLKVWSDLPTWAKGVIAVGGLAAAYFAVKGIIDRVKKQSETAKAKATITEQVNELENLQNSGVKKSYNDSQYNTWADAIQKQFDGCDFSVENAILPSYFASYSGYKLYTILDKLKNDADFLALSTAYDVRTYDQCGLWTGNFTGNLSQAVADELTESEIEECNKLLAKKGITYRF